MTTNRNDPLSDANDKTAAKQKTEDKKTISRRSALKVAGAAAIGCLCSSVTAHAAAKPAVEISNVLVRELRNNKKTCTEFMTSIRGCAKTMVSDRRFAARLLENIDSVQLVNLYNQHRDELEPITGKIDGRTMEGRYIKMMVATELFSGVSGFDKVFYSPGSEELQIMGSTTTASSSSGSSTGGTSSSSGSSSCSGCDTTDPAVLGCCIVHFWGWTSGGACSPCKG